MLCTKKNTQGTFWYFPEIVTLQFFSEINNIFK